MLHSCPFVVMVSQVEDFLSIKSVLKLGLHWHVLSCGIVRVKPTGVYWVKSCCWLEWLLCTNCCGGGRYSGLSIIMYISFGLYWVYVCTHISHKWFAYCSNVCTRNYRKSIKTVGLWGAGCSSVNFPSVFTTLSMDVCLVSRYLSPFSDLEHA